MTNKIRLRVHWYYNENSNDFEEFMSEWQDISKAEFESITKVISEYGNITSLRMLNFNFEGGGEEIIVLPEYILRRSVLYLEVKPGATE